LLQLPLCTVCFLVPSLARFPQTGPVVAAVPFPRFCGVLCPVPPLFFRIVLSVCLKCRRGLTYRLWSLQEFFSTRGVWVFLFPLSWFGFFLAVHNLFPAQQEPVMKLHFPTVPPQPVARTHCLVVIVLFCPPPSFFLPPFHHLFTSGSCLHPPVRSFMRHFSSYISRFLCHFFFGSIKLTECCFGFVFNPAGDFVVLLVWTDPLPLLTFP